MQDADLMLLYEAIDRGDAVVLSLPRSGSFRHHRSRFLARCRDGFLIEAVEGEDDHLAKAIESRVACGLSFRDGSGAKILLAAPIFRRLSGVELGGQTRDVLLMSMPLQIKAVQRRTAERFDVPPESGMNVRLWKMKEGEDLTVAPSGAEEIRAQLRDVSLKGVGLTVWGEHDLPPEIAPGDRLRLQISKGELVLLAEVKVVHPREPLSTRSGKVGLQFTRLAAGGQRTPQSLLIRLIGEVLRAQDRHLRKQTLSA